MQFEEICFYWMQPAKVAVDYIKEHYEEENKPLELRTDISDKTDKVVDIKEYKLVRGEQKC
jgi:hypothetical protein